METQDAYGCIPLRSQSKIKRHIFEIRIRIWPPIHLEGISLMGKFRAHRGPFLHNRHWKRESVLSVVFYL